MLFRDSLSLTPVPGSFSERGKRKSLNRRRESLIHSAGKRWSGDVFPSLVPRKQWQVERQNVKVNDIVTVAIGMIMLFEASGT